MPFSFCPDLLYRNQEIQQSLLILFYPCATVYHGWQLMIRSGNDKCPFCGEALTYYDTVRRIVLTKRRVRRRVYIRRFRCLSCNTYHRELPPFIFLHKWYESEIIQGVIEGLITSNILGFEDYPCEDTMKLWRTQHLQRLLWEGVRMEDSNRAAYAGALAYVALMTILEGTEPEEMIPGASPEVITDMRKAIDVCKSAENGLTITHFWLTEALIRGFFFLSQNLQLL